MSQLPLVTIRIGNPSSGKSTIIVMEYVNGIDYIKFAHYLNACASYQSTTIPKLSKCELKQLLSIAHSDQEREVIR